MERNGLGWTRRRRMRADMKEVIEYFYVKGK